MTFKFYFLYFMASFLLSGCATSSVNTAKQKKLSTSYAQLATSLIVSGHYPEAIKEFQNSIRINPQNFSAHHNLAIAYMAIERLDLAEQSIKDALNINPDYTKAQNTLSKIMIEKKEYDRAIRLALLTLQDLTYSEVDKSYENIGLAYLKKGQNKEAGRYLQKAISRNGENCSAFYYYALSLYHQNAFKHSLSALDKTKSICQNRSFQEPHYYSGLIHLKLGQKKEAQKEFLKIIKTYPESKYARKARKALQLTR